MIRFSAGPIRYDSVYGMPRGVKAPFSVCRQRFLGHAVNTIAVHIQGGTFITDGFHLGFRATARNSPGGVVRKTKRQKVHRTNAKRPEEHGTKEYLVKRPDTYAVYSLLNKKIRVIAVFESLREPRVHFSSLLSTLSRLKRLTRMDRLTGIRPS